MLFQKRKKLDIHLAQYIMPKTKKKWWPKILFFFVILITVAGFFLIPLGYRGWKIYNKLLMVNDRIDEVVVAIGKGDFVAMSQHLEDTRTDLLMIKSSISKVGPILWFPQIDKSYRTGDQMLRATIDLLDGYGEIISVFTDLQKSLQEEDLMVSFIDDKGKKQILESIVRNRSNLELAKIKINKAKKEFNSVNTDDLTGIWKEKIVKANDMLGKIIEQSEEALPIFKYLPELVGYNQDRVYLILFQNNMELRPTGGFIGSYGLVTMRDGSIKNIVTDDIYNLDKLSKDKLRISTYWPMEKYMGQKYLFMRDANWSPDWPTSVKQLEWFWDIEREYAGLSPQKLDGVIGITPDFISNFLSLTGPITVDGITFTSENFALELEKQVEFEYEDKGLELHERKQIIGSLTQEIIYRLEKSSAMELLNVWGVMKKNKDQKHILAWFKEEELQKYFSEQNWSGEVKASESDYLMIIDSNLAALKTDQVIERELNYFIGSDQNNNLVARAEIVYRHAGKPVKHLISKYKTYTRVYLPDDTEIDKVYLQQKNKKRELVIGTDVSVSKELGKTVVGVFFDVDPLSSKTLVLEYRLPKGVSELYFQGKYSLLLQKQAGTPGHKLQIDLRFGKNITACYADFLPLKFLGRHLFFQGDLSRDRLFRIKL